MREYDKHVTIIQKPGLYIQALPNPDTWKGETGPTTPDHWGYVYVNNDQFTRARFDAALKEVPQEQKDAWNSSFCGTGGYVNAGDSSGK